MSDEQIIEAMMLQDEIDKANSVCEDIESDELHEHNMRTDLDYFLKHSEFAELKEMYQELSQKACEYGWCDVEVKGYL